MTPSSEIINVLNWFAEHWFLTGCTMFWIFAIVAARAFYSHGGDDDDA